jgi:hypothetical protein
LRTRLEGTLQRFSRLLCSSEAARAGLCGEGSVMLTCLAADQ